MKLSIFLATGLFCVNYYTVTAQNFTHYRAAYAGKKINSTVEQTSKPSGNSNQAPIKNGGMTITVSDAGQSTNTVSRNIAFSSPANAVTAQCSFVKIKTVVTRGSMEFIIDTDNPFERPTPMEKLGERYDNLVKEKSVYRIDNNTSVQRQSGSSMASNAWNENLPFLSLDSTLNCMAFNLDKAAPLTVGKAWTENYKNDFVEIQVAYTVKALDDKTLTIECTGTNIFMPPPTAGNPNVISMQILNLTNKYTGTLLVNRSNGLIQQANFEATTTSRKNVMGQNIDSERLETIKVVNKLD
jgi:hypothetical protein